MLGSTVLDVAIGVVLTFLGISLATSAITEGISSALKWREKTLLAGIRALVSDDKVALALYNHALVNPLSSGVAVDFKTLTQRPSYIDARDFASALYRVLAKDHGVARLIADIENPQLQCAMTGLWESADGDVARFKIEIGRWFDRSMDRLSGWYKQRTQLVSFLVALGMAISLNANVLYEGAQIWTRPGTIAELQTGALAKAADALPKACDFTAVSDPAQKPCFAMRDALDELKAANLIGWGSGPAPTDLRSFMMALLSWIVVAGSTLFGAAFWFDTLQRLTQLRGTGLVAKKTDGHTPKPDIAGRS